PGPLIRWKTLTSVDPGLTGTLTGQIEVSGGGTSDDVIVPLSFVIGPSDPFAVKSFDLTMTDAPTVPAQRAGSDPKELKTDVSFPAEARTNVDFAQGAVNAPPENFKDT